MSYKTIYEMVPDLRAGFTSIGLESQLPKKLRQEDGKFKVYLDYTVKSCFENKAACFLQPAQVSDKIDSRKCPFVTYRVASLWCFLLS